VSGDMVWGRWFPGVNLGKPLTNGRVHIAVGCGNDVLFFELMPPGPLTRTILTTWSPTHPLVATALDTRRHYPSPVARLLRASRRTCAVHGL